MNALAQSGAALLGGVLRRTDVLGGGSLSQIVRIALCDGREAIVKNGPAPLIEAAMLGAIAASGAPAPKVLAASSQALVIEVLADEGGLDRAWASLGGALRTLHAARGERYGWSDDYAFGSVAIENDWSDDWPRFWAERRLLNHQRHLPGGIARRVEALAADLPNRLPAAPVPSLLHGDLWGGNVLAESGRVSGLIDPACYYGHVEVDIAMLTLFDRPDTSFYSAYGPLEPGHEQRLAIYRLWPALVHVRLFGSSYRAMVEQHLIAAGV